MLNFEWDMKLYFLHMKANEVGTTLKNPKTINGYVKNLSKRIKMKDRGKNLTLPSGSTLLGSGSILGTWRSQKGRECPKTA